MFDVGVKVRIIREPLSEILTGTYTIIAVGNVPGAWLIDTVPDGSDFDESFLEVVEE